MSHSEENPGDNGEEDVRYDLAGNPLPSAPKAAAVSPPPLAPGFSPPPGFTPPPGHAPLSSVSTVSAAPSGSPLYLGLGVAVVLLVALIFGLRALKPAMVAAPSSYKTYTAIDNTFSCDQPAGWTMHETGATNGNLSTVTFSQSHVRVRVISDATGSVMGDIAAASNNSSSGMETPPGMPPPPPPKPAVEQLHERDKAQLSADLPGYQEGDMQRLDSRVGDSRFSEWTADDGKLHGYRATLLGREREITVICIAPEKNWTVLQPAFQRILASVVAGNGT